MAGENEAVTLLRYQVNNASVAAAVAANKQVEASLKGVGAAASSSALRFDSIAQAQAALGLSNEQLGITESGITQEKTRQLAITERLALAEKVRRDAVEETAIAELRAGANGGGGGGQAGNPGLQRNLFNARQAAIALPGVGYQSPLTVGIRGAEILVEKTGASLVQLGAAAGIAGVALVAVAVAFDQFTKGIEASKKVLTGALSAQDAYYKALGENTSEQVATQIEALKNQRDIIRQQRDETQGARDRAFALAQQLPGGDPLARGLEAAGLLPGAQLQTQLDELNKQFEATDQTITRLQQGLEAGVFATNDAAEAEKRLAEARAGYAVDEADVLIKLRTSTQASRDERIAAINDEIAILTAQADAEGKGSAAGKAFEAQIISLRQELRLTEEAHKTYGDALEVGRNKLEALRGELDLVASSIDYNTQLSTQSRTSTVEQVNERLLGFADEKRAIESLLPRLAELAPRSEEAAQAFEEAQIRLVRLSEDASDQLTRVLPEAAARGWAEVQARIAEVTAKRDSEIAAVVAEDAEKNIEQERELGERRAEVAQDNAEKIAKIERDAGRAQSEAIGNRDANAFRQAEIRRADALEDQNKSQEKADQRLLAQYQKTERLEATSLDKRTAAIRAQADAAIRTENDKGARINALAANAGATQSFLANQTAISVTNSHAKMYNDLNVLAYNAGVNLSQSFQNGLGARSNQSYGFPTLTSSIGAALPAGARAQVERLVDSRLAVTIAAARGGRTITA